MAKEEQKPIFEAFGFDPKTLTLEDIAFIRLCRKMGFGTIQDVAINNGRPTVVKTVTQRLDLTSAKEGIAVAEGRLDLVTSDPSALLTSQQG